MQIFYNKHSLICHFIMYTHLATVIQLHSSINGKKLSMYYDSSDIIWLVDLPHNVDTGKTASLLAGYSGLIDCFQPNNDLHALKYTRTSTMSVSVLHILVHYPNNIDPAFIQRQGDVKQPILGRCT